MSNTYSTLVLGAVLSLGTLAFTGTGASAAAMLPLSSGVSGDTAGVSGGIIQVDKKHKRRHHRRFRDHCDYEYGGCGNFYPRYRYHAPFILGGGFGGYNYYNNYYDDYDYYDYYDYDGYDGGGWSSRHVRYCSNKYRSYNRRNNTWVSHSGRVRQCRSPYL